MTLRDGFFISVFALLAACGGAGPHSREAGAANQFALTVKQVAWNPTNAAVGKVSAVADDHDVVAVFSDNGANVFRSGALVAHDTNTHAWSTAATIPSIDGASQWIVATDKAGGLYYLRNLESFALVSDRYGFGKSKVRGAGLVGTNGKLLVGFALDNEVAIAEGAQVTRFAAPTFSDFGAGGSLAVGVAHDEIDVVDASKKSLQRFALPGAAWAAVTTDGKVYAATPRALYGTTGGALTLLYEADDATIHGLVASGAHVWFADADELGAIEDNKVAETSTKLIARDATIASSPSGDVWVMSGGALTRFERPDATPVATGAGPTTITWDSAIQPVFARSCATCHLPGGVSGTDLSTSAAWNAERANIRDRVIVHKTMPPQGHPLSDADRAAIESWIDPSAVAK